MNILVYIDHFRGQALPCSWELIGLGKRLGKVTAAIMAWKSEAMVQEAFAHGADEVLWIDHPTLDEFRAEPYATSFSKLARRGPLQGQSKGFDLLLLPNTTRGKDIAAISGVDLQAGVMVDAIALSVEAGYVTVSRPVYSGKMLIKETCLTRPAIVTVRPRAFPRPTPQPGRQGPVQQVRPAMKAEEIPTSPDGYALNFMPELGSAALIIAGGRGMGNEPARLREKIPEDIIGRESFYLLYDIAILLGGTIGASRGAVEAGFSPYVTQIGQTGRVVSPQVYIACAISGAPQHLAGVRTSQTIIAINQDPQAPIFKVARYGAVAEVHPVLRALIEVAQKRLGKRLEERPAYPLAEASVHLERSLQEMKALHFEEWLEQHEEKQRMRAARKAASAGSPSLED